MKILGIDIGLNNLGLAIIENNKVLKTKLFTEISKESVEQRLFSLHSKLEFLILTEFSNTIENILVFEKPYFSFNSDTGKVLDYVVGNILYLGKKYNFKIIDYTATEIKKSIEIEKPVSKKIITQEKPVKAKISKRDINKILVKEALLRLNILFPDTISDHEIDAIASGYCYLIKNDLIKF